MNRRTPRGWSLVSWVSLAVSVMLAAMAFHRALTVVPMPELRAHAPRVTVADASRNAAASPAAIGLTADPFRPDHRLPDDEPPVSARDDRIPPSTVTVRLLGTVVRPDGGFVVCQLASDAPRIVHVGEKLGLLTLVSLEQGSAVFRSADGSRLELTLGKPGG